MGIFRRRVDWVLADGMERHALSPTTFRVPGEDAKAALQVGDRVKLMVVPSEGIAERLWVVVTAIGEDELHGAFVSDATELRGLRSGDAVSFGRDHVVAIAPRSAEPVDRPSAG